MTKTKKVLREGDRVRCILNKQIKGVIVSKNNYHGCWLYHIRLDNQAAFNKRVKAGTYSPFLHWQLEKNL